MSHTDLLPLELLDELFGHGADELLETFYVLGDGLTPLGRQLAQAVVQHEPEVLKRPKR